MRCHLIANSEYSTCLSVFWRCKRDGGKSCGRRGRVGGEGREGRGGGEVRLEEGGRGGEVHRTSHMGL